MEALQGLGRRHQQLREVPRPLANGAIMLPRVAHVVPTEQHQPLAGEHLWPVGPLAVFGGRGDASVAVGLDVVDRRAGESVDDALGEVVPVRAGAQRRVRGRLVASGQGWGWPLARSCLCGSESRSESIGGLGISSTSEMSTRSRRACASHVELTRRVCAHPSASSAR